MHYLKTSFLLKSLTILIFLFPVTDYANSNTKLQYSEDKNIKPDSVIYILDSIRLSHISPKNIKYITDKNSINKSLEKINISPVNNIIVYGIKETEPKYEFYLLFDNIDENQINIPAIEQSIYIDTIIGGKRLGLYASFKNDDLDKVNEELNLIINSFKIAEYCRMSSPHVMSLFFSLEPPIRRYFAIKDYHLISENRIDSWNKLQAKFTAASFLGGFNEYDEFLERWKSRELDNEIVEIINKNAIYKNNVHEKILSLAKEHRIVMINEQHFNRKHRKFLASVLEGFKEIGYNYLALEGLSQGQDSILNFEKAYPTRDTGFYTSEQNFANLIRKAKDLGYTFVAYENFDREKEREAGQAENLYNKTFDIDENAKVLVFAGLAHILEKPDPRGKKWMAMIFKEEYNIDPLTISQTHLGYQYTKSIDNNLALINSKHFKDDRHKGVDYHLINNVIKSYNKTSDANYSFTNSKNKTVQLSLYYAKEFEKEHNYYDKLPFHTTILKPNETFKGKLPDNETIYLHTFDMYGDVIDEILIK